MNLQQIIVYLNKGIVFPLLPSHLIGMIQCFTFAEWIKSNQMIFLFSQSKQYL